MFADWHFTTSLRYPPRTAAVLLSLFEVLDAPQPDAESILDVLAELRKADPWARIHAAPKLLAAAARSRQSLSRIQKAYRAFFMALPLPARSAPLLVDLAEETLAPRNATAGIALAQRAASLLSAAEPLAVETPAYFELINQAGGTLFAACLERLADHETTQAAFAQALARESERSLAAFLTQAAAGSHGRGAALAQARTLAVLDRGKASELVRALMPLFGPSPLTEPDFVETGAELLMRAEAAESGSGGLAQRCEEEAIGRARLAELRMISRTVSSRTGAPRSKWNGLNAPNRKTLVETLWLGAIWRIFTQVAPKRAIANILMEWTPRVSKTARGKAKRTEGDGVEFRILGAASAALRAARAIATGEEAAARQQALRILVNCDSILRLEHRKWLIKVWNSQSTPVAPSLPDSLTALALSVRRRIHEFAGTSEQAAEDAAQMVDGEPALAATFADWAQDFAMSAGASPAARPWIALAPKCAAALTLSRDFPARDTIALLLRLFHSPEEHLSPDLEWMQRSDEGTTMESTQPPVRARDILRAPPTNWRDWEPLGDLTLVKGIDLNLPITAALERVLTIEGDCPPETRRRWLEDLDDLLGLTFSGEQRLDRFLVLRLSDLFVSPWVERPSLLETALEMMLQHGQVAPLERAEARLLESPPDAVGRDGLLTAYVAGLTTQLAQRGEPTPEMLEPGERARLRRERRFLAGRIAWLLAGAGGRIASGIVLTLRSMMRERRSVEIGLGGPPRPEERLEILDDDGERQIHPASELPRFLHEKAIEQAIEDPLDGDFTVLYTPWLETGHSAADSTGMVFSATDGKFAIVDLHGVYSNGWGPPDDGAQGLAPGSPVRFSPGRPGNLRRARIKEVKGAVALATVGRDRDGLAIRLSPPWAGKIAADELDLWAPDISSVFRDGEGEYSVEVRYDGKTWRPLPADLTTYLLRQTTTTPTAVTFTFSRATILEDGSRGWLFAARAGELYEFREYEFTAESAREIHRRVHSGSAAGLLITLQITEDEDVARFRLSDTRPTDTAYPDLTVPFDERNTDWRTLFTMGEATLARCEGAKNWWIDVESPPGFPKKIAFGPIPGSRAPQTQEADVQILDFRPADWRNARVWGVFVRSFGFKIAPEPGGMEPQRVFEFLADLRRNPMVELIPPKAENRVGNVVPSLTAEGLRVMVTPESLSFAPGAREIAQREAPRSARITSAEWLKGEAARLNAEDFADFADGSYIGYIVKLADVHTGVPVCRAIFATGADPQPRKIEIGNLAELRKRGLTAGARLKVEVSAHAVRGTIERLYVRAVALWTIRDLPEPEEGALFLGETHSSGRGISFLCQSPTMQGEVLRVPAKGRNRPPHLSIWRVGEWTPGVLAEPWEAEEVFPSRKSSGRNFRSRLRPIFETKSRGLDGTLSGRATAWLKGEPVSVRSVLMHCDHSQPGGLVMVERDFAVGVGEEEEPAAEPSWRDRDEVLAELANEQEPIACVLGPGKPPATTSVTHRELRGRAAQVPVAADALARITENRYEPDEGRMLLRRSGGEWCADFLAVPSLTIEEFHAYLGQDEIEHDSFYFVGPLVPGETSVEGAPREWLFEFGYGWRVRVPAPRLLSGGRPFDLEHQLFLGDRVLRFSFVPCPLPDESEELALNLINVLLEVERSPASRLWEQAREYKFVHVLRLHGPDARVVSINACGVGLATTETFNLSKAKIMGLPPASPDAIIGAERSAYGRMDTRLFETTHGAEVCFHHVRLAFSGPGALRTDEVFFVKAAGVEPTASGNDTRLRLVEVDDVDSADIDRGFNVSVFRREFSRRESLLRRLAEDPSEREALKGQVFAIRLQYADGREGFGSLVERMPERRIGALHDYCTHRVEPTFGVVFDNFPGKWSIELQPGIFFPIEPEKFEIPARALLLGTIVRVAALPGGRFALHVASLSSEAFFQRLPRQVVALPKDSLRGAAQLLAKTDCFSVGDFPELTCRPATIGRDPQNQLRLRRPNLADWRMVMQQPHPKIASIHAIGPWGNILVPASEWIAVGRLVRHASGEAEFQPLPPCGLGSRPVPWRRLTFADEPVRDVAVRCMRHEWRFHDRGTVTWERDWVREDVPTNCCSTGPLFFEERESELRLRYSIPRLFGFGLPSGDLIETFGGGRRVLHVAAPTNLDGHCIGIWVEAAPGRVHFLSAEILVWTGTGAPVSLTGFECRHFASGDKLTIRVAESSPRVPAFVEIQRWQRGPRVFFRGHRVLLPVVESQKGAGALLLGAGRFSLMLPDSEPRAGDAVWLSPDNEFVRYNGHWYDERKSLIGRVCLLGRGQNGNIVVLGAPEFRALPDWSAHPLAADAIAPAGHGATTGALLRLIDLTGGALPATIEKALFRERIVFFSFREQTPQLAPNRFSLADVVGFDPDGDFILWLGRGLIRCACFQILPGMPERLQAKAAAKLIENHTPIFVRADDAGTLHFGQADDPIDEDFPIQPEFSVGAEDDAASGMVVRSARSARLHWLPSERAGWTTLNTRELERAFLSEPVEGATQRPLSNRARMLASESSPCVSLIDTEAGLREAALLVPNAELQVVGLPSAGTPGDLASELVRSYATGLLLRCASERRLDPRVPTLAVVVLREKRRGRLLVTVVPNNERIYRIALPTTLLTANGPRGMRPAFAEFLQWVAEADDGPPAVMPSGQETDQSIEKSLWRARALAMQGAAGNEAIPILAAAWRQLDKQEEFGLLPALLLLSGLAHAGASGLLLGSLDRIGRRALRSVHVELFSQHWHSFSMIAGRPARMLERAAELLRGPLGVSEWHLLHRWIHAGRLSIQPEIRGIAAALACATGNRARWVTAECSLADVLVRIAGIRRALLPAIKRRPSAAVSAILLQALSREFDDVVSRLLHGRLDVTLLSPLPRIDFSGKDA